MPDNLLISSPNNGGIFYVKDAKVLRLDERNVTGLFLGERGLAVGLQPDRVQVLGGDGAHGAFTGGVLCQDIHDVLCHEGSYYVVGTLKNEVICLDASGVEHQRWVFPGEEDACHINCLAIWNGKVVFSAFGDFLEHRGYKGLTSGAGFVQELESGRRLISGLSQPHSLVQVGENLLLANSERNELVEYASNGERIRAVELDGYTRGIHVSNERIYVGLSRSRNATSCSLDSAVLVALDRHSWAEVGRTTLPANEIYSVLSADPVVMSSALASLGAAACARHQEAAAELQSRVDHLQAELSATLAVCEDKAQDRKVALDQSMLEMAQLRLEMEVAKAANLDHEQRAAGLLSQLSQYKSDQSVLRQQLRSAEGEYRAILASNSWALTEPLRQLRSVTKSWEFRVGGGDDQLMPLKRRVRMASKILLIAMASLSVALVLMAL